jgi:ABC-type transport system involved in multi-copper enzyme maturation permease subunit
LNNPRLAWVIARRELGDHLRDWRIVTPIVFLVAALPVLMDYISRRLLDLAAGYGADIRPEQIYPFLLMVVGFFPVSVALVLALESFVGEKERRSLEPLLSSPVSESELYLGKLIASLIPPLAASYLGMGLYLFSLFRHGAWLPDVQLLLQVFALATGNCLVMVSGAVVVSAQTTSMRAANLLAIFIILPMALLLHGQSAVIVWARDSVLWWTIGGLLLSAALLIRTGVSHFNREELIGRDLDSIGIRWGWSIFKNAFKGEARSPREWYRQEIAGALRRLRIPSLLVGLLLAVAVCVGIGLARRFVFPPELIDAQSLQRGGLEGIPSLRFFDVGGIPSVWYHNLRAIILAAALGMFSYGVLAMVVMMLPFTLIGYFTAASAAAGVSPILVTLGLVAPHGVLEVPAIILAGAAILRLGAALATPSRGQTIGETWLIGLADWAKVMVAVVVPLLFGAAALEVLLTPQIALFIFGG